MKSAIAAIWIIGAVLTVAFWIAIIFVALHFIGKVW